MSVKIQKVSMYVYVLLLLMTFIGVLSFMTDYFTLYVYGTSEMGDFYNMLQVFNKEYFNQVLVLIVLSVILYGTSLKEGKVDLFKLVYGIIVFVLVGIITYANVTEAAQLENMYLAFDFSVIEGYEVTTFWFDVVRKVGMVFVGFNIFFAIIIIKNFVDSKKGAN